MDKISDSLRILEQHKAMTIRPTMDRTAQDEAQIEKAAEAFETTLTLQMLQQMQKSLDGGTLFGGGVSGDVYSGLAEWELARILSRSVDFGVKSDILRQLEQQRGPKP